MLDCLGIFAYQVLEILPFAFPWNLTNSLSVMSLEINPLKRSTYISDENQILVRLSRTSLHNCLAHHGALGKIGWEICWKRGELVIRSEKCGGLLVIW